MAESRIFISHRHEDAAIAEFMRNELQKISKGSLLVFISEDIDSGEDWRDQIVNELNKADYLFLIYSDPGEDWSWCFYEVGFFHHKVGGDVRGRIFCFHQPESPVPSQISHLQQPSAPSKIAECIRKICADNGLTQPDNVNQFAKDLIDKISQTKFSGIRRVIFEFDDINEIRRDSLPAEAKIIADASTILTIFGFSQQISWAHILQMVSTSESTLQPYDIRWLNEIIAVINRAVGGVIISPQCVLFSRSGDIRHRFVFSHVKRGSDKKFICEFIVCEDVSGPAKNVPASLLSLMTSIRMATRIRHEFIDFIKFREAQTSEAISEFISQKRSLIFAILTEAETRGSVDLPNLLEAFNNPFEKNRVEIMSYLWPSIAEGLGIDVETLEHDPT